MLGAGRTLKEAALGCLAVCFFVASLVCCCSPNLMGRRAFLEPCTSRSFKKSGATGSGVRAGS
eukprot:4469746-Alexandrium_andersonii.AAC.1